MGRRPPTVDLDEILAQALSDRPADGRDGAGDGGPGPGGADDGADTAAMIDATSGLLAAYGLRRWTMDDVAERAGLARATVYRRFESRDRLVRTTLVRDARRFFAAVAAAVAGVESFDDKVVEGFVVGLELVRLSPVPQLLRADPAAALSLVTSESILRAGRRALVESYETLTGQPVDPTGRSGVEAVAEALIRLGLSMLLTPGVLTGGGPLGSSPEQGPGPDGMRRALDAVIRPLISGPGPAALTSRS